MLGRMPSARRPRGGHQLRSALLALLLTLVTAAVITPAALSATPGGGNAFGELTEGQTEATKTARTATTSRSSTEPSNNQTVIILAMVAAVALLVGIAFVIARDARKVAPAAADPELTAGMNSRNWAAKQRKRRAKAKAARRQRKRTR
jgi:hypothetical protein